MVGKVKDFKVAFEISNWRLEVSNYFPNHGFGDLIPVPTKIRNRTSEIRHIIYPKPTAFYPIL